MPPIRMMKVTLEELIAIFGLDEPLTPEQEFYLQYLVATCPGAERDCGTLDDLLASGPDAHPSFDGSDGFQAATDAASSCMVDSFRGQGAWLRENLVGKVGLPAALVDAVVVQGAWFEDDGRLTTGFLIHNEAIATAITTAREADTVPERLPLATILDSSTSSASPV